MDGTKCTVKVISGIIFIKSICNIIDPLLFIIYWNDVYTHMIIFLTVIIHTYIYLFNRHNFRMLIYVTYLHMYSSNVYHSVE